MVGERFGLSNPDLSGLLQPIEKIDISNRSPRAPALSSNSEGRALPYFDATPWGKFYTSEWI